MKIPFFDLSRQNRVLWPKIEEGLHTVLEHGDFILGEQVRNFESTFGEYIGRKKAVSCANGSDALELALQVLEIGRGDEVIVPAFGWLSPALAVKRMGATPILVDVELETGNLSIEQVRRACGDKTKAIIPIHLYGNPCRIDVLETLAEEFQIHIIEDAAQAHGASLDGRKVGSFGSMSIFSFYPTKNLGCWGDGGMVLTTNGEWAEKLYSLRNYGRTDKNQYYQLGRNSRLDEIQATILLTKMQYLEEFNAKRRHNARQYCEALRVPFLENSVYHQFCVRVRKRSEFRLLLDSKGIETGLHYPFTIADSLNLPGEFPIASRLSHELVSLPIYPELTEMEISYICDRLKLLKGSICYF